MGKNKSWCCYKNISNIILFLIISLGLSSVAFAANTWTVDDDTTDDSGCVDPTFTCKTIQAAIDAAADGDTINVAAGTYSGKLIINKPLILKGPNADISPNTGVRVAEAIITGTDVADPIIEMGAGDLDGLTIEGFEISDVTTIGQQQVIHLIADGDDVVIRRNRFIDNSGRIFISTPPGGPREGLIITDNLIDGMTQDNQAGMQLFTMNDCQITNNVVRDTTYGGIQLGSASDCTISGNEIENVPRSGIAVDNSNNVIINNNTVTNAGNGVDGGDDLTENGGITIYNPDQTDIKVTNNTLTANYNGIAVRNDAGQALGSGIVVNFNSISGNVNRGADNAASSGTLDATNNWWGDASGPTHESNPSGNGDAVSDNVNFGQWCLDSECETFEDTPPETTKTYGEPNEAGLIEVEEACDEGFDGEVNVSGHFITTATTVTLDAEDPEPHPSGVADTFFTIEVPSSDCDDRAEFVGLNDSKIYENIDVCEDAFDTNPEEEGIQPQQCVATAWSTRNETTEYSGPFTVVEESVHKICFFSADYARNEEELQCQVVLVDDNVPVINGTSNLREIIDIENYEEQTRDFNDPKCTLIFANVTETHDVEVKFNITSLLRRMFVDISGFDSFNEENYQSYLEDRNEFFDQVDNENGFKEFEYEFCPSEEINDLRNSEVFFDVFNEEEDFDTFLKFISEGLLLGEFEVDVTVTDEAGKEAQTTVNVTIVDLTVPLESGWNLRSTPLDLEGDIFWGTDNIDLVFRFDSETQSFEQVIDDSMVPLDALYMHATGKTQYGTIFERDFSVPSRLLHTGWNLVGLALPLQDFYNSPDSCEIDNGHQFDCHITRLEGSFGSDQLCVGEAFVPVVYDSNGNRGIETVIALPEDLNYESCDDFECFGFWSMSQQPKLWIPDIDEQGANPDNPCENLNTGASGDTFLVKNFGGYWAFMNNPDLLPGFTTTPLPVDSD